MLMTQRIFLLLGLTTALVGCSSIPKQTEADIPLVHSSLTYSLTAGSSEAINVPELNSAFNDSQKIDIIYNNYPYEADKQYISALGNACIRFHLSDKNAHNATNRFTTCKKKGQWTVIPPLVVATDEQGE